MFNLIRILFFFTTYCLFTNPTFSQDAFRIVGGGEVHAMSFKMINNLIILPVEVNGSKFNFLLDTGVDNSIMFNLSVEDSLKLKRTQRVHLRGLGEGGRIEAIKSDKNYFKIGKVANGSHRIYLIPGKDFDLSGKLGVAINGIIGGGLFRNFIIEINYSTKRIKFFDPLKYQYKKCKKCQDFPLDFYKNKPYIYLTVESENTEKIDAKLLIDLGGSDALWLFDKSSDKINLPEKYFEDYLGKGLSGNIYGKRSKIDKIALGNYIFTSANVAYPDSTSVESVYNHKERNGTLGSEILKRFRIIFDYPNKKMTFKDVSKYFDDPFVYNMSGIELSHSGSMLVPERQRSILNGGRAENRPTVEIIYSYVYALKPSYQIVELRKNSPAEKVGLQLGDIIIKLNDRPVYNYKLEEIIHIFSTKPGKKIRLLIDRNGEYLLYAFTLEKILK